MTKSTFRQNDILMTKISKIVVTALLAFTLTIPLAAHAQEQADAHIKQLALDAILENPEIIAQAIALLRDREEERLVSEMRAKVEQNRESLENDPNAPVLGKVDGDVTVVEFFDYNCPYCKQVAPEVLKLLTDDQNIKLVYREWPILGDDSMFAARAALAAREQGLYEEFHWSLMSLSRATQDSVLKAARELGLDMQKLRADMMSEKVTAHIGLSMRLANAIGFSGTPSFVIGDQTVPGAVSYDEMRKIVEDTRASSEK